MSSVAHKTADYITNEKRTTKEKKEMSKEKKEMLDINPQHHGLY